MLTKPQLRKCYAVGLLTEDRAVLVAENSEKIVEGNLLCAVLSCLDKGMSSDDIAEALSDRYGFAEVYYAIAELTRLGLLEEADGNHSPEAVFESLIDTNGRAAADRDCTYRIAVAALEEDASTLVDMLQSSQASRVTEITPDGDFQESPDLTIVVAKDYLQPELTRFNRTALERGIPWLPIKPAGIRPWVGPLFVPGETGCLRCLEERLRSNREVEEFIRFMNGDVNPPLFPLGSTAGSRAFAQSLAVGTVTRLSRGEAVEELKGKILTFDWNTMELEAHHLVQLPHCPECGTAVTGISPHPEPPKLVSRRKKYRFDGGHRIVSPEETIERYKHLASTITGVLRPPVAAEPQSSPTGSRPGLLGFRIYGSSHASVAKIRRLEDLKKGIRSGASAGKGLTDIQARAGCICEAIERVSGIYRGTEHRFKALYSEVRDRAYHPHDLLLFSEKQYRERERWAALNNPFAQVPVPFDESQQTDWSPVWSLTHNDWKLVPTAFLYFGYHTYAEDAFCTADSNGNAAGNCLEEAVLQGLMELVERDAVAVWWYNTIPMPAVNLAAVDDPTIARFVEVFEEIGRKIWVLDITSDLGIPVFAAFSSAIDGEKDRPAFGFGAHPDPRTAFNRALSEMAQGLLLLDVPPESHTDDEKLGMHRKFVEETKLAESPHLLPAKNRDLKKPADYADMSSDDVLEDVKSCVEILDRHGMEVLICDQTRPDLGLNVVKAIVPGLRHFWARYAPGRLYDVPVKLGWLEKPKTEDDLNPTPIFF